MSIRNKLLAIAAVSALTAATAVPAMALENEFHGMYKFNAIESNFFNGTTYTTGGAAASHLTKDQTSGFFAEQRARVMYTAKANDNLKLITHFELDTRFGGITSGYKGTVSGNDGGQLDADSLTLETKNVYLDFNVPGAGTNVKAGLQPWKDSYDSLFLLADMTGVNVSQAFGPLTASLAWFRFSDQDAATGQTGKRTADLIVADAKYAVNKDMTFGVSYYNVQNDTLGITAATPPAGAIGAPSFAMATKFDLLHVVGANAALKFGPAAINVYGAYQFGEFSTVQDISAYMGGATAKIKAGPGSVNVAGFYLSGDGNQANGDRGDWQTISAPTNYFNPSNMTLLVRNGTWGNSSTSVTGTDLTVGGRGMWGVFAGYGGSAGKVLYSANAGYAEAAHATNATEKKSLGVEVNAEVGYKLYDNLTASIGGAYLFLGDGLGGSATQKLTGFGGVDAENPWSTNVVLSYVF